MILNPNILRWVDSLSKQEHRKWWAFEDVEPVAFEEDSIPPFQLVRSQQTGDPITELVFVSYPDLVETDVLAEAQATGLEVAEFDDYDLIIYPSTLLIGAGIERGYYYLRMSDGTNTWYTDVFALFPQSSLDQMIKIEYWHAQDFYFDDGSGHIRYQAPYKSRAYICSDIARPDYQYKDTISERNARNLPRQRISYKLYKFNFLATESMIDAFRLIRLHDFIEISYSGYVLRADDFLMLSPDWRDRADIANVNVEFTTDSIFVTVNGKAVQSTEYLPAAGSCVMLEHNCVGLVVSGSSEHSSFEYIDSDGNTQSLVDDDKIIIQDISGNLIVNQYNSSTYTPLTTPAQTVVFNQANGYYYTGIGSNQIALPQIAFFFTDTGVIAGTFLPGAVHYIYAVVDGSESLVGQYSFSEMADDQEITIPDDADSIFIRFVSAACGVFQTSNNYIIPPSGATGIGAMVIGGDNIVG